MSWVSPVSAMTSSVAFNIKGTRRRRSILSIARFVLGLRGLKGQVITDLVILLMFTHSSNLYARPSTAPENALLPKNSKESSGISSDEAVLRRLSFPPLYLLL